MTQRTIRARRREAAFWLAGIAAVALADPSVESFFVVCPLHHIGAAIGWTFCPGCGLGHAVGWLVRGDFAASYQAHPLALPAVLVLLTHAVRLLVSTRTHAGYPRLSLSRYDLPRILPFNPPSALGKNPATA